MRSKENFVKHPIGTFCTVYGLGQLLTEPKPVNGGLMHAMYRVCTTQGEYAVKVLNADIMKRPTAYQNMVNSEVVSHALKDTVPLVAAKTLSGKHVIEFEGAFWMVFDWLEGKSIYPPDLTERHCSLIGDLLGRIHAADIRVANIPRSTADRNPFLWRDLLTQAETKNSTILPLLQTHLSSILAWDEQLNDSWALVQRHQVISHRDLDPKNILWKDGQPFIIDWEAAGYVNPAQELVEILNYWIVDADGQYSRQKFDALMNSYTVHADVSSVDWSAVLSTSFAGMLGWLEYNIKRALGLEGSNASDRAEGEAQVQQTLRELCQYQLQINLLYEWLSQHQ